MSEWHSRGISLEMSSRIRPDTYYDGSQPQYTHLRASMLAYAHINLLSMLSRFDPEEAVRVATDSIYVQKTALSKLTDLCLCSAQAMRLQ